MFRRYGRKQHEALITQLLPAPHEWNKLREPIQRAAADRGLTHDVRERVQTSANRGCGCKSRA
jgi:hypothetical protein